MVGRIDDCPFYAARTRSGQQGARAVKTSYLEDWCDSYTCDSRWGMARGDPDAQVVQSLHP
jgi:hypothetical protein